MPPTLTYLLGTHPCASETFIQREVDALRRRGWKIDVVSLHGSSALQFPARGTVRPRVGKLVAATLRHALPLIFHLPRLPFQLLRRLPQTAALIQRIHASGSAGVHAHFAHLPADIARLAARQAGVPFTCSVHAWDVFAQPAAATRRRLQSAAAVCACSQAAVDAVCAAGVDARRVYLIRHGLPLDEYTFEPMRKNRRIVAIGRLEPKKGFDLLLAACARLRDASMTCEIIGEGSQRRRLEQCIAAHNLAGMITLRGEMPPHETCSAIREAAVLVLPSRRLASGDRDGVANVLLEAMALGTPVVTTTAGAAGEVVRDGVNGRLVAPEDAAALAAAIRDLLDDPAARTRLARVARTTVEADFDEERTITLLEQVLGKTSGASPIATP
ncbi:MAG: glycosyltransferase [bacterium]